MYPILGETYRLKEMFRDVYDIEDCEQAKGYFSFWRNMAI
ncbi:hypothetical protein BN938_0990 [Mucinivorans hirudinis]|uniref:Uncharacterized protein n=1 Tax=Mucinivorans hirudinis TaxID=1433126 RepID=A0A060RBB5_9BACT|nr:hypothetical protein BN938_0990 [Mucinivorans hirudinis]